MILFGGASRDEKLANPNMILNEKDLQMLNTMPSLDHTKKDPDLKIEFDGTTVLCRVCGDKASGFHYGVHSCEGCKGFFRRSIQQKIQYRPCTKNQQCNILRVNRNRCQYCRLKKCIAVGMSRDAVRFGRVPKREKAKILAAMQCVNARSQEQALAVELEDEAKLVDTIVTAHDETSEFTMDKIGPMMRRAREESDFAPSPSQLACPLNPRSTVLTNGNLEVVEVITERFSPAIRGVVEFAKRIPAFNLLSQDDQVTLLKAGVFEVLLLRLACMFDARSSTMMCLNGQLLQRDAVHHTSNARFLMDSMFDFAERINMLRLLESELGLFSAIVIIAADRPGLRNVELVERMQGKLMDALSNAVSHNHPQTPNLLQDLMKKIPDLRTLSTLHSEKLLAFRQAPHIALAGQRDEQQQHPSTANGSHHHGQVQQPPPPQGLLESHCATDLHALYQSQVGHWNNAYGMVSTPKSVAHEGSEDSKNSWDEGDHLVPSPQYAPQHHQMHPLAQQQPPQQHHHHLLSAALMRDHVASEAWSPESRSDASKEHEMYGGSPSSDAGSTAGFLVDDGASQSPDSGKGSSGADGEFSSEMARLTPNAVKREEGSNSSSGDESYSPHPITAVDSPPVGTITYKRHRKLNSPTDSGIESGKDLGSAPSSGSDCSSPRSLVMDEDKLSKSSGSPQAADEPMQEGGQPHSPPRPRMPSRDMPVLKRALQAPPLINTNQLMDEAYKPHKKFRALRKDSDSGSPTPTSPEAPTQGRSQSPFSVVAASVSPPAVPAMPAHVTQSPSLASTHSMLVRSLEQAPRMSEQQLKRTDIIHNIIMCSEAQQQQQQQSGQHYNGHSYSAGQTATPVPAVGTVNKMVCPPYYIPQSGSGGNNNYGQTSVTQASWSNFVTGAQAVAPTASAPAATSSQVPARSLYVPAPSATSATIQQMSQLQQHLQMNHQQPTVNQPTDMSPPLHPMQHHHYQLPPPQQQQQQQPPSSGHSPLPRLYYHLQSHQRGAGSASSPRSNPPSPVSVEQCKPMPQQQSLHQFRVASSSPLKSVSPVTVGQSQQGELRRLMVASGPHPSQQSSSSSENQPLNLSKKVASPPPMSVLMASLQQDCSSSALVHPHRLKLEAM